MDISGFSVTQIFREIIPGECRSSKAAGFFFNFRTHELGMLILVYFSHQKVQKFKEIKIQRLCKCVKLADFEVLDGPTLSSRKI